MAWRWRWWREQATGESKEKSEGGSRRRWWREQGANEQPGRRTECDTRVRSGHMAFERDLACLRSPMDEDPAAVSAAVRRWARKTGISNA